MTVARLLVNLSFVASISVGCSGSATPTAPSSLGNSLDLGSSSELGSAQLSGVWNLVAIQPAGEPEQARPSGASYTLTLSEGRLSTRADCNSCGGTYTLTGQTLVAGPSLACTRAACATMAFENTFTKLLSGESIVSRSGRTLVLTSPRGVLRFMQ